MLKLDQYKFSRPGRAVINFAQKIAREEETAIRTDHLVYAAASLIVRYPEIKNTFPEGTNFAVMQGIRSGYLTSSLQDNPDAYTLVRQAEGRAVMQIIRDASREALSRRRPNKRITPADLLSHLQLQKTTATPLLGMDLLRRSSYLKR